MNISEKLKEALVKLKFSTQKSSDDRISRDCEISKRGLLIEKEDLEKLNKKIISDFSYGPDGPDQQLWQTTILLDDGSIYQKSDIKDYDKKRVSIELLIDGRFIKFPTYNIPRSNLYVENKENNFIETSIDKLPKDLVDRIKSTIEAAEAPSKKSTNEDAPASQLGEQE